VTSTRPSSRNTRKRACAEKTRAFQPRGIAALFAEALQFECGKRVVAATQVGTH
jgi:hypothetical protein